MKTRIGIIFGGNSVEHEISILSAIQASHAIDSEKYDYYNIYMTKDGCFWVGDNFDKLETFKKEKFKHYEVTFFSKDNKIYLKGIKRLPKKYKEPIDVILPIVHGKNVEDGSLAGFFKIFNIPYAASSVLASSIIQNKQAAKIFLDVNNVPVIDYKYVVYKEYLNNKDEVLINLETLDYPVIVKPVSLGSSIGIKIASDREELLNALTYAFKYENEVIVEKKLTNFREFNQAILELEDGYELSLIEEVKNINPFLTFQDKYLPSETKKEIPAKIPKELEEEISEISSKVAKIFKPNGVIRIDYLYDFDTGNIYLNEINAIPGSLSYYLFEEIYEFPKLIDILVKVAIKNHYRNSLKLNSFKSNVLSTSKILKK